MLVDFFEVEGLLMNFHPYNEFRLQDMTILLQATGVVESKYTPPRTFHARKFFSRVAQVAAFCVLSQKTIILPRMSCFALCLILHFPRLDSAFRLLLLCFSFRTGQILVQLRKDSCLAVLPNRFRSHHTEEQILEARHGGTRGGVSACASETHSSTNRGGVVVVDTGTSATTDWRAIRRRANA